MSLWTRFKFLCGIIGVFILVGLLVLYLNDAMSTVWAKKAELSANTTTVGVDYPGLVTDQRVSEGDKVKKGQTLFVVSSPQLMTDIANRTVSVANLPFDVDRSDNILVKANGDGVVERIQYLQGSYVPAGAVIATLDTTATLYVSAHFHLSPPDYARLKKNDMLKVTLPDNSKVQATVYNFSLAQDGDVVDTIVKARLPSNTTASFRFPVGTPVEASLKLTQRTWWQSFTHFLNKLFSPSAT